MRNVYALRRQVGMVFPLPVGLPLSVYENVAYAPRRAGMHDRRELDALVEKCLRQAMLWDEVKDRLDLLGTRALRRPAAAAHPGPRPLAPAGNPLPRRVLHRHRPGDHDEDRGHPARAEGGDDHRAGDQPGAAGAAAGRPHGVFQRFGRLIEVDETEKIFTQPAHRLTERYVNGDFG